MKKVLLTTLVVMATVCFSFAQEATSVAAKPGQSDKMADMAKRAREWQNTLVTELKLTEDQVKKMDEMNKMFGERRVAIENNADLTAEAKAERKAALKKAKDAQFAQLLTTDQQAKYAMLMEARMKDAPQRRN